MLRYKTSFLLLAVALLLGACSASDADMIVVGDVGPGGGIVFITPDTKGNTTGRYFEAAPSADETKAKWCSAKETFCIGIAGTAIGTGESNTTTADATCTSGAIQIASDYTNNGLSDWFLPSKDELNEMYVSRNSLGGFSNGLYWSSSENVATFGMWHQDFSNGNQYFSNYPTLTYYVRPVRAFS